MQRQQKLTFTCREIELPDVIQWLHLVPSCTCFYPSEEQQLNKQ